MKGSFISHATGRFQRYASSQLFIAMEDTALQRLLFQRVPQTDHFNLDEFHLNLLDAIPNEDIFIYLLVQCIFSINLFVFGVDCAFPCGPYSNVDFINIMWQHFKLF
jgi:hypothetical protein